MKRVVAKRWLLTCLAAVWASPALGHVQVNYPNGGEQLEVGSVVTIEWQILISHSLLNWDVWYSTTGSNGPWIVVAVDLPPGSGSVGSIHTYDWTIPNDINGTVWVRVIMDNAESAVAKLSQLRTLGVQIHIDDFGTGYSSLSYLQRLPVDTLKIDRTFVSQLGRQAESQEIVSAIITLARNLGMGVAAEGVETAEQARDLRQMNCEYGQGFFYYRPLESLAVEALLAN